MTCEASFAPVGAPVRGGCAAFVLESTNLDAIFVLSRTINPVRLS